jgi:hypothetical protein
MYRFEDANSVNRYANASRNTVFYVMKFVMAPWMLLFLLLFQAWRLTGIGVCTATGIVET